MKVFKILLLFLALIVATTTVLAANGGFTRYKATSSSVKSISSNNTETVVAGKRIEEHNVCKKVNNGTGKGDLFIPTKTAGEWSSVHNAPQNSLPSGLTLKECATVCTDTTYSASDDYRRFESSGITHAQSIAYAKGLVTNIINNTTWSQILKNQANQAVTEAQFVSENQGSGARSGTTADGWSWEASITHEVEVITPNREFDDYTLSVSKTICQ